MVQQSQGASGEGVPASAAPPGFQSADNYDPNAAPAPPAADEIKVPDDLYVPEGGDETPATEPVSAGEERPPAPDTEGAEEAEEAEWEVEGHGKVTATDIQTMLTQRGEVEGILEEYREMKTSLEKNEGELKDLSQYKDLKTFFDRNPDIRRKFEAEIGQFEQLSKGKFSDDPQVAQLQREVGQMRQERQQEKFESAVARADKDIEETFGALRKDHPDIVDAEFQSAVLDQLSGTFKGDPRFDSRILAVAAKTTAFLMQKVTEKASKNGQAAALRAVKKPGVVRLAPAGTSRDSKSKPKDYKNMTADQVAAEFVKEVGAE